jgi:hypothetical protein
MGFKLRTLEPSRGLSTILLALFELFELFELALYASKGLYSGNSSFSSFSGVSRRCILDMIAVSTLSKGRFTVRCMLYVSQYVSTLCSNPHLGRSCEMEAKARSCFSSRLDLTPSCDPHLAMFEVEVGSAIPEPALCLHYSKGRRAESQRLAGSLTPRIDLSAAVCPSI